MPFNFLSPPHLRLLSSSSFFLTRFIMKSNPSVSKGKEAFTRVFPHKLKYQSVPSSKKLGLPNLIPTNQQFSTRASKHSSEGRSSKSLIEDEAELSDWVSELKSDSFKKSRLYSESEDDGNDWRGGGGSSGKRKREGDFDRERGRGGSRGSFNGDSRGKGRSGGEFGRRDDGFASRRENGFGNGRGGRDSGSSRGRGGGRFGGEVEWRNDRFSSNKTSEDDGFVSKRREDSFSGRGRGGRGGGGVGRGGKSMGRKALMSDQDEDDDEEEQKNIASKFRELISDEEDDDDDEDEDLDDDDEVLGNGHSVKKVAPSSPRTSPDGSESYLSETRY